MSNIESQSSLDFKTGYQVSNIGYMNQGQGNNQGNIQSSAQGPSSSVSGGLTSTGQQGIGQGATSILQFHGNPQMHSLLPRASSTLPQFQQYPGGYYSDQYLQYQQMLGGGSQTSQPQHPQPINHLGQYQNYMSIPQQYPYSYYMQNNQSQNQSDLIHPYGRYSNIPTGTGGGPSSTSSSNMPASSATSLATMPSKHSIFQQPVPQISGVQTQVGQPYTASSGATIPASLSMPTSGYSGALQDGSSAGHSAVGQYQPPGIRPRVTTTMWEDEKTLCYQVDANNVSVVRRADNNMINGTKLLNVAQMTRGRRDGILKSEKVRHVVKIGSMHLKGVWIPFERALAIAEREGIVDLLYPLFVRDIKRVIQTGVTPASSNPAMINNIKMEKVGNADSSNVVSGDINSSAAGPHGVSTNNQLNTPGPSNATTSSSLNFSSYYPQYAQQQLTHSNSVDQSNPSNQSPNQNISGEYVQSQVQPLQTAQQVYNYQQPYYAASQYYQPYNHLSLSSYGGQPVYSYGYINQSLQPQLGHSSQVVQPQQSGQISQYANQLPRDQPNLGGSSMSDGSKMESAGANDSLNGVNDTNPASVTDKSKTEE